MKALTEILAAVKIQDWFAQNIQPIARHMAKAAMTCCKILWESISGRLRDAGDGRVIID